ncbi:hypothetical protein [Nocardioides yefusunii]|uniref:Glycosyltransferase n=1 Tax=Nocardioides yefusunii TaxID=2500546 RepID=A0ABW1QSE4_9ACTN|nr:hypothetical protein [Nocardioides yefusunii]
MDDPDLVSSGRACAAVPLVDGELPLAPARNVGARYALERGARVLVFLDVDCLALPGLGEGYRDAERAEPDVVWSGPVTYLQAPLKKYPEHPEHLDRPHPPLARLPRGASVYVGRTPTSSGHCHLPVRPPQGKTQAVSTTSTSGTEQRTRTLRAA